MKKYSILVFITRAQPFHNAHLEIVKRASAMADKVIVVIGSAHQPRTYKNPFTSDERSKMISSVLNIEGIDNYVIEHNRDTIYNDVSWASRIQSIVLRNKDNDGKIGIIGHKKDSSSAYLDYFPQWDTVEVDLIEPLNATDIRELYFRENPNLNFIKGVVPIDIYYFLDRFKTTEGFKNVIAERIHVETYKKGFESLPYAPIFVTTDAVVIQSGHVLLVKRRSEPGKNLYALPGGFVNAKTDNSIEDAMIRELREETAIKVQDIILRRNIVSSKVFDAVGRSARGRTITHAYHIQLADGPLPRVKGHNDAIKAVWMPLSEIDSNVMFEDHIDIIDHFVGLHW